MDKKVGIKLPAVYDAKVKDFVQNNFVMKNGNARVFTDNFIVEEMKKNWEISTQNQLLFIWYGIYLGVEKKDLYDGNDGDEKRLEEFEIALDYIEDCSKRYVDDLKIYINKSTEELNKQAEEKNKQAEEKNKQAEEKNKQAEELNKQAEEKNKQAEELNKQAEEKNKQAEETIRHTMSLDSAGLKNLTEIYELYIKDPSSVTASELEKAKELAAYFISDCKKYGIDYKKLLSPEVRKFYGIE